MLDLQIPISCVCTLLCIQIYKNFLIKKEKEKRNTKFCVYLAKAEIAINKLIVLYWINDLVSFEYTSWGSKYIEQ